jgi:hypothetical protein
MKTIMFATFILVLTVSSPALDSTGKKPTKNTVPLSADEIAIYRAVLRQYASHEPGLLNVSATTYPLDSSSPMNRLLDEECIKGIKLEKLDEVASSFHDLTADVLPSENMRLVDPSKQVKIVRDNDPDKTMRKGKSVDSAVKGAFAAALFSISEIAFDEGHHHAVVSYRFWCGSLCGNGAALVFEKVGGEWKRTDRNCGGWVS